MPHQNETTDDVSLGKVWLVGAGPGDPGLLTVRGRELLTEADVVLHDALSHPALLELCPGAQIEDVGKRFGERSPPQEIISNRLIELAREGKRVVRLKGGDPFLFARGAEEALALAEAGIPFEVVPGISSPVATSAYAGISLTHRDLSSSVTFITGSDREGKEWSDASWKKLATATDTLCVLMGMRRIVAITEALMAGGRSPSTPSAVISWGSRADQRVAVATLGTIAELAVSEGLSNPAVIVVGEVVRLRDKLRWFDLKPLFGRRILVPRAAHQAEETARQIRGRGAEPITFPLIEIVDPPEPGLLERAVRDLSGYGWVVFTSANGVERFFAALARSGRDARAFASARIGVIGPKTAQRLAGYGLTADLVAERYVGEELGRALLSRGVCRKVLIPRALEAREALPQLLRESGATVDVVPAYQTLPISAERQRALVALFEADGIDVVLLTSGSTVQALVERLGPRAEELLERVTLGSIGPVTSAALAERGLRAEVTASSYTVPGLLDALEAHFSTQPGSPNPGP